MWENALPIVFCGRYYQTDSHLLAWLFYLLELYIKDFYYFQTIISKKLRLIYSMYFPTHLYNNQKGIAENRVNSQKIPWIHTLIIKDRTTSNITEFDTSKYSKGIKNELAMQFQNHKIALFFMWNKTMN